MTPSRHRAIGGAVLVATAIGLAACSGTSSTSKSTTTTTSADDVALAQSELIPASDFPAGWLGQGDSSKNTSGNVFGGISSTDLPSITSCLGVSIAQVDRHPAEAAEQAYGDPSSAQTVTDTVDVFPSAAAARFDTSAASNPKLPSCFAQFETALVSKKAPKNMTIGTISAKTGSIPAYGDQDAVFEVSFPFTYRGVSGSLYLEFVVIRKGRSESNLQFTNTGGYPPSSLVNQLSADAANALTT